MTQFVANGLSNGALYCLVALGFGLILGGTRTFHIAHGATYVVGAYACYALMRLLGWPLTVSFTGGVCGAVLTGLLVEAGVYYPLVDPRKDRRAPSTVVLVSSLGAYIVIVNILALCFGNETMELRPGIEPTVTVAGAHLTHIQVAQMAVAVAAVILMWILLSASRLGKSVRALADNPELLGVFGYSVRRLRLGIVALGSALAAVGGILSALDVGVDPNSGFDAVLVAAAATILGGGRSFLAPALGAFLLGLAQGIVVWQTSAKWSSTIVFAALVLVLFVKPRGLMTFLARTEEM